jgi:Tfp pilus assembly protein PilX
MIETGRTRQRTATSIAPLRRSLARHRRGVALAVALVTLLVVSLVAAAVLQSLVAAQRQARQEAWALQAEWLAEAGLARGEWQLARSSTYTGETWLAPIGDAAGSSEVAAEQSDPETTAGEDSLARGRVTIRVTTDSPRRLIVEAFYPDAEHHRARVRRERTLDPAAALPEESP